MVVDGEGGFFELFGWIKLRQSIHSISLRICTMMIFPRSQV